MLQHAHLGVQVDGGSHAVGDGVAHAQRGVQAAADNAHIRKVAHLHPCDGCGTIVQARRCCEQDEGA